MNNREKLKQTMKEIQNESNFWDKAKASLRMLRAFFKKDYTPESKGKILFYLVALIYAISPLDFIPDLALPFGLMDDAAILIWAWGMITKEIYRFMAWEKENKTSTTDEVVDVKFEEITS